MRQCPTCGSPRIHRSRSRGLLEQVRKTLTSKRLHRCHSCGWRGWGLETEEAAPPDLPGAIRPSAELHVIDALVTAGKGDPGETDGDARIRLKPDSTNRGRHGGRHHHRSKSHL